MRPGHYLACTALALLSGTAYADGCSDRFTSYGVPTGPTDLKTTDLCRKGYLLRYYDACKDPLLVTEYLDPKNVGGVEPRDKFHPDPDLPDAIRAHPQDYRRSGYDTGHLAPAADFKLDRDEMYESFHLSNASPQAPRMNRGPWRLVELRARALSVKLNGVFVYTGVIFSAAPARIGAGVCVGDAYYKVITDKKTGLTTAYLMANVNDLSNKSSVDAYQVPVTEVERRARISFSR